MPATTTRPSLLSAEMLLPGETQAAARRRLAERDRVAVTPALHELFAIGRAAGKLRGRVREFLDAHGGGCRCAFCRFARADEDAGYVFEDLAALAYNLEAAGAILTSAVPYPD